jgi:hypothetical protein
MLRIVVHSSIVVSNHLHQIYPIISNISFPTSEKEEEEKVQGKERKGKNKNFHQS